MHRDERILELALDRWSQRRIAAEVGLTQVGVSKALRRILRRHLADVRQEVETYRIKLLLMTERRARVAREGHDRSCQDVTIRRQRKTTGGTRNTDATTAELETHSAPGNPHYLAVEQRCDEFAAQLLGLQDGGAVNPPSTATVGGISPADVRLLSGLTTETLERVHADLTRPSPSDTHPPTVDSGGSRTTTGPDE